MLLSSSQDIHKCRLQTGKTLPSGPSSIPVGPGEAAAHNTAAAAAAAPPPAAAEGLASSEAARREAAHDASAATSKGADTLQFAARQLGLHYLKRYFLLICYRRERARCPSVWSRRGDCDDCAVHRRTYLDSPGLQFTLRFDEWVHTQPELEHLLHHLSLQ